MPCWPPTPSALSVTDLATSTDRPSRVVGLHWFNPAPVMDLVEVVKTVVTDPSVVRGRRGAARQHRQERRHRRRPRRLHRERPAVRLPQQRRAHVRGQVRLPRGHRRRHALRLRPPDGPAGAARPDRPRQRLRDPRDDVPPEPRPPARAGPAAQAVRHRGAARPQVRPGHLHLRRRRLARGRRRRRDPGLRRAPPRAARCRRSPSSAPARWPPGSSRSAPRAATTSSSGPAATTRSRPCRRRSRAAWPSRCSAAS